MVSVKPLSTERTKQLSTKRVKDVLVKTRGGQRHSKLDVESPLIFGSDDHNEYSISTEIYNKKGRIDLSIPIPNAFLCGIDFRTLTVLLGSGIHGASIKDIAEGKVIYSVFDDREYDRESFNRIAKVYDEDDTLIGGNYLRYLIDRLDPVKEAERRITYEINKLLKLGKDEPFVCLGVYEGDESKDVWLFDDFYVSVLDEEYRKSLEDCCENLRNWTANINDYYSAKANLLKVSLPYLTAAIKNKDNVKNLIMESVLVLPIGYRESIENRTDPLTDAYNKLVGINNGLSNILYAGNALCGDIMIRYADLYRALNNVMLEKERSASQHYKPLLSILKGKKGLIRNNMQGVRSDNTGRAVIVVDPFMSIKKIGIPKDMLVKLLEDRIISEYESEYGNKSGIMMRQNKELRMKMAMGIVAKEDLYIVFGRQPTLHRLGMQAFIVVAVEGNAIKLNPLCVVAFNADFDGDQGHIYLPVTEPAKEEVKHIMANTNNFLYPRNGEVHVVPRHEILYGLWYGTKVEPRSNANRYEIPESLDSSKKHDAKVDLITKVINQQVEIDDVIYFDGELMTVGKAAVKSCLRGEYKNFRLGVVPLTTDSNVPEVPVTEKFFKAIIKEALNSKARCVNMIDEFVRLGFGIAEIHPPNISVVSVPNFDSYIEEFDRKIEAREEKFYIGMETEEEFAIFYNKEYSALNRVIKEKVSEFLGVFNGFYLMKASGARGNDSNLMQVFGMKGRIMKSSNEAFNTIIPSSLAKTLTGLEHFISAYGAREGVIEKVIETAKPGYLTRKTTHACSFMKITSLDCGTDDGLFIDYDTLKQFMADYELFGDEVINNRAIRKRFIDILIGRYILGRENPILTEADAVAVYNEYIASVSKETKELHKGPGIKIRSGLKCRDPICQKCYGIDLSTNHMASESLPIGYIAAQSIGEPGTQLTMKNFQKGGVVSAKNLTSSFDTMEKYLHLYDLVNKNKGTQLITYDFISPVAGKIVTSDKGNGTKSVRIMGFNVKGKPKSLLQQKIIVPSGVALKDYVEKGETINKVQGEMSIRDVINYRGNEAAKSYLTLFLYNLFAKEIPVNLKHFEVVVAAMCMHFCVKGNEDYIAGSYYNCNEVSQEEAYSAKFIETMKGIKEVPLLRHDFFASMFMEDIRKAASRNILLSDGDTLTNPIVRVSFGLSLGMGTDDPNFLRR